MLEVAGHGPSGGQIETVLAVGRAAQAEGSRPDEAGEGRAGPKIGRQAVSTGRAGPKGGR